MPRRPAARLRVTPLEARLTPAGWLDPAWGAGGYAPVSGPSPDGYYYQFAFLPDGGAVLAQGSSSFTGSVPIRPTVFGEPSDPVEEVHTPAKLVRLDPAGAIDPTFGGDGTVELPAGQFSIAQLAPGPNNTIYVLGSRGRMGDAELVRLTATGELDPTFDADGVVEIGAESGFTYGAKLVVRPDGGAVVGSGEGPFLAVVGPNGEFAPAAGGLVLVPQPAGVLGGANRNIIALAATPDGGLLAVTAGLPYTDYSAGEVPHQVQVVTKLTAAGELDTSYGTGGRVLLQAPGFRYSVAPAADGGAVVTVSRLSENDRHWLRETVETVGFARLTPAGQLDTTFAGDGLAELGHPLGATTAEMLPLPDGRILLTGGGVSDPLITTACATLRVLLADGSPDPTVGDGGWVSVPLTPGNTFSDGYPTHTTSGGYPAVVGPTSRVGLAYAQVTYDEALSQWVMSSGLSAVSLTADTPAGQTVAVRPQDPAALPVVVTELPFNPFDGDQPIPLPISDPPPYVPDPDQPPIPNLPFVPGDPSEERVADPVMGVTTAAPPAAEAAEPTAAPTAEPTAPPSQPQTVAARPPVAGDLDADGTADGVTFDGPRVGVLSGRDGRVLVPLFAPFEAGYTGSLNAALGDFDGDGRPELVVAPEDGGGPVVAVYRADGTQLVRFFGIEDVNFRGGARVAAADLDADGAADLVVAAGVGGGPRVAVFDGHDVAGGRRKLVADFFAFEEGQRNGANVAAGDLTGDGAAEVVFGAAAGGGPRVTALDGRALVGGRREVVADYFAAAPADRGGVRVAVIEDAVMNYPANGLPSYFSRRQRPADSISLYPRVEDLPLLGAFVG